MKLRPSHSKCWSSCTAQPGFVESIKDRLPPEDTTFTGPGVEAHAFAAKWLESGSEPNIPDPEMHAAVRGYVEFVKSLQGEDGTLMVEQNLPLPYETESKGGTIDATVIQSDRLIIADLKYGQGVSVEAVGNTQLVLYAWAAYLAHKDFFDLGPDTHVALYIFQPRCREGEPIRGWSLSLRELEEEFRKLETAAANIHMGLVEFAPSPDTCKFCPARRAGLCSAYVHGQAEAAGLELLAPEPLACIPSPHALTPEQRSRLMLAKKEIISFLNAVEESMLVEALAGKEVPGWKLVAGRPGNRKWKDEPAADRLLSNHLLKDERYEHKLISPTKAERLLKDKQLSTKFQNLMDRLVERADGKPSLAPETDPRPALVLTAESAGLTTLENPEE